MNTMRDRFLGSSSFLRQAPDAPSGGSPSGGSTPAPAAPSTPSTPSSTPAPAPSPSSSSPSETPATDSGEKGIDFDLFFGDGESPEPAPTPKAPEVVPPKALETPPVATAKPVESPKPAETPAAPAVAAAPSPTGDAPASTSPPLDPSDPGSLARHLGENEEAMIAHVAKSMFAISDKEMEELETNVGEAIPKLLAKTFVKMQTNMLQQVARLVPGMVQRTTEAVQKNAEGEAKFFAAWPALKPELHKGLVQQYAGTYRQMHPQATFDQMIRDLGPLVMMAAQVSPTAAPSAASAAPKSAPFIPSVPGATVISTSQVDEDSAIAALDPNRQE